MNHPFRLCVPPPGILTLAAALLCAAQAVAQLPSSGVDALLKRADEITLAQAGVAQAGVAAAPSTGSSTKSSHLIVGKEGPWGQLEYYPVFLEAADLLIEKFPLPNTRTRWAFQPETRSTLPDLFRSAELSEEFITALMDPATIVEADGLLFLFPPQAKLETMSSEQRTAIYAELRKIPANEFHYEPVLIPSGDVDAWFRGSAMRPELVKLIKQMSYMRGDTVAFSDLATLITHTSGEAEARSVLKACTRTRSYIARLRVKDAANIAGIIDYWTTGLNLRRKDIEPLLTSLVDTEGVSAVDLMHILPPLPRKLLLSYPDTAMAKDGIMPDCHWTSLNFFNYTAQPYLLDSRLATSAVLERFAPVGEPYRYGDILFFLDSKNGDAFHSCVYLADNLVFSKNGRNVLSPWLLTTLDDLKKVYLFDGNGTIQGYRNKQSPHLMPSSN